MRSHAFEFRGVIWTPSRVNGLVSIRDVFFIVPLFAPPAFSPHDAPELFLPSGFLTYVTWILWLLLWWRFCIVAHGRGRLATLLLHICLDQTGYFPNCGVR